jgi:oxygen-independent coproporphyrinogen-3 oxidase
MSHLYLHIPFCKQACHYCDFHFSTSLKNKDALIGAMLKELVLRKNELPTNELETIYFGGGTPSLLTNDDLKRIFSVIHENFDVAGNAEITLEANPDDLSAAYVSALFSNGINRLSIGIQSFRDEDLKMMNRAHNAAEAMNAVKISRENGITNISVDLIYGIPGLSDEDWKRNLAHVLELNVQHLSSYCLTIEPRTALADFVKKGKAKPVNEEEAAKHFETLMAFAKENNFDHYEISNFAKENFIARHNSSYWFGEPYLGIGPSAHSYHGNTRRWNVANNAVYIERISSGSLPYEEETLSEKEQFNEMVMTGLRTKWGINLEKVKKTFGEEILEHLLSSSEKWLEKNLLEKKEGHLITTEKGKLLADRIASDLFLV